MRFAQSVPVLMYHHVSPVQGYINASVSHFEDQLRWLRKHGYRSLSSDQFAAHLAGQRVPSRSILITFDDGYLDNWVYAAPLLRQYGFSAMLFIVTSWLGDGPVRPRLGDADPLPETPTHQECEARIAQGRAEEVMLRWSEVQQLREEGTFEFHSHTHTHTRWDLSPDAADRHAHMQHELTASRQTLQERLGQASEHFCWPQGYYEPEYVRLAQAAGFRYLYTTQAFGQNVAGTDPSAIFRFAVRNTSGASVGRRVWVAADPIIGSAFNRWKRWKRSLRR